jgi:ceramide glucosyltransferase
LPWAALAVILARGATWAWALFACTGVMRVIVAILVGRLVLHDRQVVRLLAWIPVRDVFALLVWIVSFAGHKIVWRGDQFRLEKGKLITM